MAPGNVWSMQPLSCLGCETPPNDKGSFPFRVRCLSKFDFAIPRQPSVPRFSSTALPGFLTCLAAHSRLTRCKTTLAPGRFAMME